ncbi:MAG: GAF domain-containing protein, partial [Gemmatimonadota bacterium]
MSRKHKTATTETTDAGVGEVLGLYQEIAGAVSGAGLAEAMARVLDRVCSFAGWPVGYGLVDPLGDNRVEVWHLADDDPARAIPQPGAGLVERVLAGGSLVSVEDLATDAELPEAEAAMEAGLRAAYAIPIFAGEEIAAVLAFFAEEPGPMPPGLAEAVEFTAKQLEVIAESEKARRAVQAAARQARAQAVELNRMAAQLRVSGVPAGDGMYDALTGFPRRRLLLD